MEKFKLGPAWILALKDNSAQRGVRFEAIESALREYFKSSYVHLRHYMSGQPHLDGAEAIGWHISISHQQGTSYVALAHQAIGLDAEAVIKQQDVSDLCKLFHPSEQEELAKFQETLNYKLLGTRYWTAKEAILKLNGHSLAQNDLPVLADFRPSKKVGWSMPPYQIFSKNITTKNGKAIITLAIRMP